MRIGLCSVRACSALLALLVSLHAAHAVGPGLLYTQNDAAAPASDASLLQVKSQATTLDASTAEGERHKYLLQRVASSFALVGSVAVPFVASTPAEIKQQEELYEKEWQELDQLQKGDNVVALELGTEVLATEQRKGVLKRLKLMSYPEQKATLHKPSHAPASTFVPEQKLFVSTAAAPAATVTLTELAAKTSRAGARHRQTGPYTRNVRDLLDAADEESNSDDSDNAEESDAEQSDSENDSDSDNDSEESNSDESSDNDSEDAVSSDAVSEPGSQMRFAQRRGFFKKVGKAIGGVAKKVGNFLFGKKDKKKKKDKQKKKDEGKYQGPKPQEVEDCSGCRYVWSQVEMDVGAARYVEDVQASFEHNCMEAQKSAIFYGVCEDMYDDMYAMTDDYMSNKYSITDMCKRAKMCGKRFKDPGMSNKATNNLKKPKKKKDKKKKKGFRW